MAYRLHTEFPDNSVEDFRSLKGKPGPIERGLFIAEGPKIAIKVLESSLEVPTAFMTENHFENVREILERGRTRPIFSLLRKKKWSVLWATIYIRE